jgi:hypothetical protein
MTWFICKWPRGRFVELWLTAETQKCSAQQNGDAFASQLLCLDTFRPLWFQNLNVQILKHIWDVSSVN